MQELSYNTLHHRNFRRAAEKILRVNAIVYARHGRELWPKIRSDLFEGTYVDRGAAWGSTLPFACQYSSQ